MPLSAFSSNLALIREQIAEHQQRGGWHHPVSIVAVTKTHGPEAVRAAVEGGLAAVGENRVQEALVKQEACADLAVEWHLIGSLQRNKARQVVGRFALIHSVDRIELAEELNRRATVAQPILVQVNCSGEPQKSGVEPDGLAGLLDRIRELKQLQLCGLMTLAALSETEAVQRRAFALLRRLRDAMQSSGHQLPELSMGMSHDYPIAVEEGATMIRLGTALFGDRV